jgi:glyoxylase-like metal-dependent hydrolase (beta-lactamase superfamily II)
MTEPFVPGQPVALSPRVRRVLAPNPGRLTGAGTNSYLIATPGGGDAVIVDPGPDLPAHVEALRGALASDRIIAIALTHSHRDHSPGAAPLARELGAPRIGRRARYPEFQDPSLVIDQVAEEGTRISGSGWTLRAVLTPGHASNHVCWYLEEERLLLTGDHILGGVSPVILPPDGDMSEYLDSLARLLELDLAGLLPGHGPRIDAPHAAIRALIAHRLAREAKVEGALGRPSGRSLEQLLPEVYADVDPALYPWARYSLHAHLIKLERDGRARQDASGWYRADPPGS